MIWIFGEDGIEHRIGGQLKALALIGILVTTPYMVVFYENKDRCSNLQMVLFYYYYDIHNSLTISLTIQPNHMLFSLQKAQQSLSLFNKFVNSENII